MKKCKPELKTIWHVQLTLDLPQFSIESKMKGRKFADGKAKLAELTLKFGSNF
ncbi:MAG: hypothetical protein JGK10_19760 [Microcoleus sp. PH2017_13_LAR_U_A]|uniref:hypothetical protein n=1 Tax=unclassified Microcoleus TaxID=2642155 RepID=UPI001DAA4F07|nr:MULTISPECIES: hypothetical protein [unclassified Microcoleus]MCC3473971.1 hypothetical protein [Microcoleus sp. PH2017_13_LAR_U_A]MCC3623933.1 hypothetical protein [Microcoleus sp. PH2017_36_ELK_O_B]